jgi:hypothetical protein
LGSEEWEERRSGSREGKKGCGDVTNRIRDEKGNGQSKIYHLMFFIFSIYLFISKCPFLDLFRNALALVASADA